MITIEQLREMSVLQALVERDDAMHIQELIDIAGVEAVEALIKRGLLVRENNVIRVHGGQPQYGF